MTLKPLVQHQKCLGVKDKLEVFSNVAVSASS